MALFLPRRFHPSYNEAGTSLREREREKKMRQNMDLQFVQRPARHHRHFFQGVTKGHSVRERRDTV